MTSQLIASEIALRESAIEGRGRTSDLLEAQRIYQRRQQLEQALALESALANCPKDKYAPVWRAQLEALA